MNWAMTRARINCWLRLASPPRNMFHRPMNRITATATTATTVIRVTISGLMGCPIVGGVAGAGNIARQPGREAVIDDTNPWAEEQFAMGGQPNLQRGNGQHR